MTKVDVFSGFLGAGKTTLIKKMIQEAYKGQKLVLIENEFGEIGIDGGFLQDAGINITEMNSGCICCSLVGYVYEEEGQVLGCILALRKICGSREELHIQEMAVLPQRQGRGIGRQLLNTVGAYCTEQGLAGMVLYTGSHAPAAKFYEKHGFQVSPDIICMYRDM